MRKKEEYKLPKGFGGVLIEFGKPDQNGDIFMPGCFDRQLKIPGKIKDGLIIQDELEKQFEMGGHFENGQFIINEISLVGVKSVNK